MITLAQVPVSQIDMNSVVSVAMLIVIVGAVIKITAWQTEIRMRLSYIAKDVKGLKSVPSRLLLLEAHFEMLEEDFNNLWAKIDNRPLDRSRRSRFVAERDKLLAEFEKEENKE